jgi:hypothetical protein
MKSSPGKNHPFFPWLLGAGDETENKDSYAEKGVQPPTGKMLT